MAGEVPRSQPARAVWIEIVSLAASLVSSLSQPARAVWIEISDESGYLMGTGVTACEGCVD